MSLIVFQDNPAEDEAQIIEKILGHRAGKRPKPKLLLQQFEDAVSESVVSCCTNAYVNYFMRCSNKQVQMK